MGRLFLGEQMCCFSDKDYLYSFPNAPLAHVLSGKVPTKVSSFPHIDVYSDKKALIESEYIIKNPPKIIFYINQPEAYWSVHEKIFRGGNKAGQRQIKDNIFKLINNKQLKYHLLGKYKFYKNKSINFSF